MLRRRRGRAVVSLGTVEEPRGLPSMRGLVRRRGFWVGVIAVVVPFGWLLLFVRLAVRIVTR